MLVYAEALVKDEGTILILQGRTETDTVVLFAADRRPGLAILDALQGADLVEADVPDHMILMRMAS